MNKKIKVSFLVFLIVILGCFTSVLAADNSDATEIGTTNLNGTAANSAKVGDQLFHPEIGWTRYDDTNSKMLFKGSFNDWPATVYYNGSTKYGIGTVLIKFYGSKFRILMSYNPDRSNSNFVTVDGTKVGQFNQIKDSLIPQALGFEKDDLTKGVHVVQIDLGNNSTLDAFDIDDSGYLIQLDKNLTLNKTSELLTVGQTDTLEQTIIPDNAPDKSVTWTSSDSSVATVDASGKVTAVKAGSANIIATTNDGSNLTSSCAITVKDPDTTISLNKTTDNLTVGTADTLNASVSPDNAASKGIAWTSSDPSIATVDASGKVTAVKAGSATITATTYDGKISSCAVTVKDPDTAISLNKTTDNLTVGATDTLSASITPDSAASKGIIWTSSDSSVATVDASGKVTAVKAGSATITAATYDGKTSSCTVTITAANTTINLTLFMQDSTIRQYTITNDEFTKFTNWYNLRANGGTLLDSYTFNIPGNSSLPATQETINFKEIESFEIISDSIPTADRTNTLTLLMKNSTIRQYSLNNDELNKFKHWYSLKANGGTLQSYYIFNVPADDFSPDRKDYVLFNNISSFQVQ
ncbi:Ig-like domain-containing protein [Clostridium felsineum]|uniref:Uncharacterized protein n=1 Tax=Clostridium felsineum TaxID=36839 RepID=A0A1S8KXX0_9CLOT|nr:Ig-like domain-containing protein [Clostridium felsineum]URZ08163.1 hypothetical protein CLROS_035290 [Clostridium felsineum]URZ13194.1 hypothetical protein CROST_039440 [Clostridium felsineum]